MRRIEFRSPIPPSGGCGMIFLDRFRLSFSTQTLLEVGTVTQLLATLSHTSLCKSLHFPHLIKCGKFTPDTGKLEKVWYSSSATAPSSGTTLMPTHVHRRPQSRRHCRRWWGRDNVVNVNYGHHPTVGDNDAVASIMTTVPHPDEAPPPSSFIDARLLEGFTLTRHLTRQRLPLYCSARKPGTILSFSRYSHCGCGWSGGGIRQ
jgi:hypothetical protein